MLQRNGRDTTKSSRGSGRSPMWSALRKPVVAALVAIVSLGALSLTPLASQVATAAGPASMFYYEDDLGVTGKGRTGFGQTGDTDFTISGLAARVPNDPRAEDIRIVADVPGGGQMVAGQTYTGSVGRTEFGGVRHGFCRTPTFSELRVHDVAYDPSGTMTKLSMSLRCDSFYAEVRFNTSEPKFSGVLLSPNHYFSEGGGPQTFAKTTIGETSSRKTFQMTAVGSKALTIGSTSVGDSHPADFLFVDDGCSNSVLPLDQSCSFGVRFRPTDRGRRKGHPTLDLDTSSGLRRLAFDGRGRIAPATTIMASALPVISPFEVKTRVQPPPDDLQGAWCARVRIEGHAGMAAGCDAEGRHTFEFVLPPGRWTMYAESADSLDFAPTESERIVVEVLDPRDWATARISPKTIYPVADGYLDKLEITGNRVVPTEVAFEIRSVASGDLLASDAAGTATGPYRWTWDGQSNGAADTAGLAPAGAYDVTVTLSDAGTNTRTVSRRINLSHDRVTWKRRRTAVRRGRDFTLWARDKNASVSPGRSRYAGGVQLASRKGFAAVVYVFPVTKKKTQVFDMLQFKVVGRSTNGHKALIAIWNKKLGGFRNLGHYDAAKIVGPRFRTWKTAAPGDNHASNGKARAAVMSWKGLGRKGKSVFDIKKVSMTYRIGTIHSASGASVAGGPLVEAVDEAQVPRSRTVADIRRPQALPKVVQRDDGAPAARDPNADGPTTNAPASAPPGKDAVPEARPSAPEKTKTTPLPGAEATSEPQAKPAPEPDATAEPGSRQTDT